MNTTREYLQQKIEDSISPQDLLNTLLYHVRACNPHVVDFLDHPKVKTIYSYQNKVSDLLSCAIMAGDLPLVKELIKKEYYQDKKGTKDKHGWSYLSASARYVDRQEIELYLAQEKFYDPKILQQELHSEFALNSHTCEVLLSHGFEFDICDLYQAGKFKIFKSYAQQRPSALNNSLLLEFMTVSLSDWGVRPFDKVYQKSGANTYLLAEYIPSMLYTSQAFEHKNPDMASLLEKSVVNIFKLIAYKEEAEQLKSLYLSYFPQKEKNLKKQIINFGLTASWAIELEEAVLRENIAPSSDSKRLVSKI